MKAKIKYKILNMRYLIVIGLLFSLNVNGQKLEEYLMIASKNNSEIKAAWFEKVIPNNYNGLGNAVEEFLVEVGRRKFLTPLYKALLDTEQTNMALSIYKKARPNYHSVATGTMDELLNLNDSE